MPLPVSQKLKIKPGQTLLTIDAPDDFGQRLQPLPPGVLMTEKAGPADQVHWFVRDRAAMERKLTRVKALVRGPVVCWIYYPKGSSGIQTDLTRDTGWDQLLALDLQWLSLISLDETWSAFGFREKTAADRSRKARSAERPVREWVDPRNKSVRLPPDLMAALSTRPGLLECFNDLAFSHKREYIEWVVSAKKPPTREKRISGTLERLEKGWKNPANR